MVFVKIGARGRYMGHSENPYERTTAMLGNRAITMQLTKQPKAGKDVTTETSPEVDWDKIGKIAQETSEGVVKVVAVAYIAKRIVDTACQIAVIAAQKKL
jgi:hypothetical protein